MTGQAEAWQIKLHRLGWGAFEDLCMQIMREALGETCLRYRPGQTLVAMGGSGQASRRLVART